MPELPEVEITRQRLTPHLVGRTILEVITKQDSYFFLTPTRELKRKLPGRRVEELKRVGKYLLARLDDECTLLLHLGMTGQLFTTGEDARPIKSGKLKAQAFRQDDPHCHLRLRFEDLGPEVCFRDVRKFGKVRLLAKAALEPRVERLGPDALLSSGAHLFEATRKRHTPIKSALLDQSVIAGIGNIYADEALFLAKINPLDPASSLSQQRCDTLTLLVKQVMHEAIKAGGSTIRDFVAPDGKTGSYQEQRLVYGRTGTPCPACQSSIERLVIAGRSTHFCAECQPRRKARAIRRRAS